PRTFPNNERARAQLFAQHAETADLRFRSKLLNDASDGRPMPKNIAAPSRLSRKTNAAVHHGQVIRELQALQQRMVRLNPRVEHGDLDSAARAFLQTGARLGKRGPGVHVLSQLAQPTVRLSRRYSISWDTKATAR